MPDPRSDNPSEKSDPQARPLRRRAGSIQGERRVVTILFCDVAGSTRMAEGLDPEDWADIMDAAFEHMIAPVIRYEGIVARLMGDAILALFGAPTAHEDDPQRALLAGLEIINELGPFRDQVRDDYGLDFNVRIGINTGPVVVGEVGSDAAGEYTAMGDAVNLASRLQTSAQPGTVHVAEATYRLTAPVFDYKPLGTTDVRGREMDLVSYQLIGPKARPGRLRGIEGLTSPIVGRAAEMAIFDQALDDLKLGRGGIIWLLGEAGLGKSRLIEELKVQANQPSETGDPGSSPRPLVWSEVRGVSYDQSRPYSLFIQEVRHLVGVSEDDTPESSRQKIESFVGSPENENPELVVQSLEAMLGVQEEGADQLDGAALRRQLIRIIFDYMRALAAHTPLVAVFDDLHWADSASIDVLNSLMGLVEEVPILLVCSMRPNRRTPGWQARVHSEIEYPHRYSEINLEPLPADDSASLVNNLLAISSLRVELQKLILDKAEGNPFFLEELIRTLIDNQFIMPDESVGGWIEIAPVADIDLPDNLQSLIIARIDRLTTAARRTLQLASVIGRSFSKQVLEQMDPDNSNIRGQLNTLERMGLVEEYARAPTLEYRFVHDLTRDAAYQSILRRQRREYHLLAGRSIEGLYPEQLDEEAHRLANHFEQGQDWPQALHYYRTAAKAAARVYANEEAVAQYSQAIDLADKAGLGIDDLTALYLRRGRLLELSNRFHEALANYEELEQIGINNDNRGIQATALIPQATIYSIPFSEQNPEEALQRGERALALGRSIEDPKIIAKALWNLLLYESYHARNYQKAIEYGTSSIKISRQRGFDETLAFGLHDISRAYQALTLYEDALEAAVEAGQLFRDLNQTAMVIDNLNATASIYYTIGEPAKARVLAEKAQELSKKTGNLWGLGYSSVGIAPIYYELAEFEKGIHVLENSLAKVDAANFRSDFHVMSLWFLSWGHSEAGNQRVAYDYASKLVDEFPGVIDTWMRELLPQVREFTMGFIHYREGNFDLALKTLGDIPGPDSWVFSFPHPFQNVVAALIADIALGGKEIAAAQDLIEAGIQKAQETGSRPFMADLLLAKGEVLMERGKLAESDEVFSLALDEAKSSGSLRAEFKILVRLFLLENAQGNLSQAEQLRSRAEELRAQISDNFTDPQLRRTFLNSRMVKTLELDS